MSTIYIYISSQAYAMLSIIIIQKLQWLRNDERNKYVAM